MSIRTIPLSQGLGLRLKVVEPVLGLVSLLLNVVLRGKRILAASTAGHMGEV